jgi:opacity protein-like surface antigen
MSRLAFGSSLLVLVAATVAAAPAHAQDERVTGPYGVARAGVAFDGDARFRDRDTAAPATFERNTDYKPGFTGEIGGGYDFGGFRLEATVGYAQAKLDRENASEGGFTADGRTRSLNLGIAGYVDIPVGEVIVPYVAAGIGASRVDARLSRLGGTPAAGSRFDDKDWGLRWHADAGIGIRATPRTTIEIGARYTRVSKLEFEGQTGLATGTPVAVADSFRPRLDSVSGTLGVRHVF